MPWIIGVGASAGGLEALGAFLRPLPVGAPAAIVVVQHLSHSHPSLLAELLARETHLEVVLARAGERPTAGRVYIAPARHDLEIRRGAFALSPTSTARVPTPSVDRFFASIADECGTRAAGVVLSGTGSDGTVGLAQIRRAGGRTFVQDPATARYDGMPTSAIGAQVADEIASADRIGARVIEFIRDGSTGPDAPAANEPPQRVLFRLVRRRTGVNIEGYKQSTVTRRVARRMHTTRCTSLEEYVEFVQSNPEELDALLRELLISVTSFFRDRLHFEALAKALGSLVENRAVDDELRIWVAGCATGEEAYSVAILGMDALEAAGRSAPLRVFATDIDEAALTRARRGVYPAGALDKLPKALVERHFERVEEGLQVRREVRDCVTFARHDLTVDPPFLRSDLVSCRNVLIYLDGPTQERVIPALHYALRENGLLFLGKSEGLGAFEQHFEAIDRPARLFRSRGRAPVPFPAGFISVRRIAEPRAVSAAERLAAEHLKAVIARYVPPTALVAQDGRVLHTMGDIQRFLAIPDGQPSLSLARLLPGDARSDVQSLLHRSARERRAVASRAHRLGDQVYRVVVQPAVEGATDTFLVAFERVEPKASRDPGSRKGDAARLHSELLSTRESLQTVVEELETQNEEMQALNEELQSTNEELQSTNEELETANEELQSTNEELTTVNDELTRKSEEVVVANGDLEALLQSLPHAVVVFDDALRVSRANREAARLFRLPQDMAVDLDRLTFPGDLGELARKVRETVATRGETRYLADVDGHGYQVRISPCELPSHGATGVVLNLVDVTELQQAQHSLARSQSRLVAVLENAPMAVVIADARGRVEFANPRARQWFGVGAGEDAGFRGAAAPLAAFAPRFQQALAADGAGESDDEFTRDGRTRFLHSLWVPLVESAGHVDGVCWMALDMTARRTAARTLERSEALNRAVLSAIPAMVAVLDRDGRIIVVNDAWRAFARDNGGSADRTWIGEDYLEPSNGPPGSEGDLAGRGVRSVIAGQREQFSLEYECSSPTKRRWFRLMAVPLHSAEGGAAVMHVDVTDVRVARDDLERANASLEFSVQERTRQLRQAIDELEMFSHTVSHDLRTSLRTMVGFSEILAEEHGASLGPEGAEFARRITGAARRMGDYLEELLKLSHLTRGELLVGEVDLSAMCREIVADLVAHAPARRAEFKIAPELRMAGDANLMRAVLENLLGNAWKFTRDRDPARIEVGSTVRGGRSAFYVRDNGVGFDMAFRNKLFLPFQRLHPDASFEGHGLGLAAAWRIVMRHGGTLDAEGRPGIGATFYLILP